MKARTVFLIGALLATAGDVAAATPPPETVNFQGVLRDAAGDPASGDFDMTFHFYDASVAGNEIFIDGHVLTGTGPVTVKGGLFSVALGSGEPVDGSGPGIYTSLAEVFRDFGDVWLEIRIAGETLSPRVKVRAAAFAMNANQLDGLDSAAFGRLSATQTWTARNNFSNSLNSFSGNGSGLSAVNAESLDGVDSLQFLRSDVSDSFDSGTLGLAPATTLDVQGSLVVQGGAPGSGKVLTSNATGLALWQDLPAAQRNLLKEIADRVGASDPSALPFAALRSFDCSGGATATLSVSYNGAPLNGVTVAGFVGREAISRPFEYLVALESTSPFTLVVGLPFRVELNLTGEPGPILFPIGEITEFGLREFAGGTYTYLVRVEPRLVRLAREARLRTFLQMSLSDVLQRLMNDLGQTASIEASAYVYETILQYDETDLEFLNRLTERDGFHYHFQQDGTVVFATGANFTDTVDVFNYFGHLQDPGTGELFIASLDAPDRMFTGTTTALGYDPAANSQVSASETVPNTVLSAEVEEFFPDLTSASLASTRAMAASRLEQSRRLELAGTGTAAKLRGGHVFEVADQTAANSFDGRYYAVSVAHYAVNDAANSCVSYGNAFTALPKDTAAYPAPGVAYSPPRRTPRSAVRGPMLAVVTGNLVDELGRIKVKLLSEGATLTDDVWARLLPPPGRRRDKTFLPEVDDEVLVGFVGGDPSAPIVLGDLYNGAQPPPPEQRLHFRATSSSQSPGEIWIEWNETNGRFEIDGAPAVPEPSLFVVGGLEVGGASQLGSLDVVGAMTVGGNLDGTNVKATGQLEGLQLNVIGAMIGGASLSLPGPIVLGGANLFVSGGVFQFGGGVSVSGDASLTGDLDVGGGDITATTLNVTATGGVNLSGSVANVIGAVGTRTMIDNDNNSVKDLASWYHDGTIANTNKLAELLETGDFRIRGLLSQSVSFDLAESFRASEPVEAGQLVRLDPDSPGSVRLTRAADDPLVIGVVSERPGVLLGGVPFDGEALRSSWGEDVAALYRTDRERLREALLAERADLRRELERAEIDDLEGSREVDERLESLCLERFYAERFVPVALAGRVPVRADASSGAIEPGDPLAPGPLPGVAVKATRPGPVIGTALQGLSAGRGTVLAFVQRGYHAPTTAGGSPEASGEAAQTVLHEDGAGGAAPDTTPTPPGSSAAVAASDNGSPQVLRVDEEGNVYARGAFLPAAMDLAEYFPLSEPASPGDVLAVDPDRPGRYRLARKAHDPAVVGIVSQKPGVLLGSGIERIANADGALAAELEEARRLGDSQREAALWAELRSRFRETYAPVALSGTVVCRVDAGFGAIVPGDLLTTSPTAGHAMRAPEPIAGTIVGKALEPLESGTGTIRVLVMLR